MILAKRLAPAVGVLLALVAVAELSAAAARPAASPSRYWIVLGSDRDGQPRAYSIRTDGSRLTPLLSQGRLATPTAVSADATTIAYQDDSGISVSRGNGTGLRLVGANGGSAALSRDGKLLAYTFGYPPHVAVVSTAGGSARQLTSGYDGEPSWAPNGKALVFARTLGQSAQTLVVRPLQGRERELVRGRYPDGPSSPRWSPDGRWIAYLDGNGLWATRPDGKQRHRVARGNDLWPFAWSPDGRRLAYAPRSGVAIVGVDGKGLRRLAAPGRSGVGALSWSPDGRVLAFQSGLVGRTAIWLIGNDGRGLRRVVAGGSNYLAGWTRLAPARPPAGPLLPSERVVDARTVATRRPVTDLSADGGRVALAVATRTAVDCNHVAVWTPASRGLRRFGRPAACGKYNGSGGIYDVELAGSRAAWAVIDGCGNYCDVSLLSATLAAPSPTGLSTDYGAMNSGSGEGGDYFVHGDGDLLVFNDGPRLVRIGVGREECQKHGGPKGAICTELRRDAHAAPIETVSGGLIAIHEADAVSVLDSKGALVRSFPFGRGQVVAARLDGGRLVVARARVLEIYDARTGTAERQAPLPSGFRLVDVDGGIAVLRAGTTVMLLRLADGHSLTLKPGRGPVSAELESAGLYYAYAMADGTGRVAFMPRAEVEARLAA